MGRTACTEPQCLYSRAIPVLPPVGRTACTEPQCLYKGALCLYHTAVLYTLHLNMAFVTVIHFARYIYCNY
jgi:hypothetical protein